IDWLGKYGAERHLFVSRALMEEMCKNSDRLRSSPRAVVYDGLPPTHLPTAAERRCAREELGLPVGRVLVLFAGQIIERKGVADLLRAWTLIDPGLASRAELVIVGDDLQGGGAYRLEMERLAGRLACPTRFVGFREDVPRW